MNSSWKECHLVTWDLNPCSTTKIAVSGRPGLAFSQRSGRKDKDAEEIKRNRRNSQRREWHRSYLATLDKSFLVNKLFSESWSSQLSGRRLCFPHARMCCMFYVLFASLPGRQKLGFASEPPMSWLTRSPASEAFPSTKPSKSSRSREASTFGIRNPRCGCAQGHTARWIPAHHHPPPRLLTGTIAWSRVAPASSACSALLGAVPRASSPRTPRPSARRRSRSPLEILLC